MFTGVQCHIPVTCKTISLLDGMVYNNSPEIAWNAEPKNIGKIIGIVVHYTDSLSVCTK